MVAKSLFYGNNSYCWLGTIVPISTLVKDDARAASTPSPLVHPPMTIMVLLFTNDTPIFALALVIESTFIHESLCMSYRETSDVRIPPIPPVYKTSVLADVMQY